jgi:phosphoribosylanthranilate isomerase
MKIKVCGMRNPDNITELAKLSIDYMGLIFYPKSPRYIGELNPQILDILPSHIDKIGVFVDEELDTVLEQIEKYGFILVQLHGQESPQYCRECWNLSNAGVIKAFNISSVDDFEQTKTYEGICNYFLFDTKTSQHGGSGQKFDWSILEAYTGNTPFFLSGGISSDDVEAIKKIEHPRLYGIDINSRFEIEPGSKKIELIDKFIKELRS